jgi:hypothetical protein
MVDSDVHLLELADGVRDALNNAGFSTINSSEVANEKEEI